MPIPPLTSDGLLPVGVHLTTLDEIQATFGSRTPKRADLFEKLGQFREYVRKFDAFSGLYVDGSFCTDKDEPKDIDVVLECDLVGFAKYAMHPDAQELAWETVSSAYNLDMYLQLKPSLPEDDMASFFQLIKPEDLLARSLAPGTKRGILWVSL